MPHIIDRGKVIITNQNNKYDSKPLPYKMNDLDRVFVHYDKDKGYNVPTENKLIGGKNNNGKNSL